jgi:hypothetical protein
LPTTWLFWGVETKVGTSRNKIDPDAFFYVDLLSSRVGVGRGSRIDSRG